LKEIHKQTGFRNKRTVKVNFTLTWFGAASFVSNIIHWSISNAAKRVDFIHVQNQRIDCERIADFRALNPQVDQNSKEVGFGESATKGLGRTHSALAEVGVAVEVARTPLGGDWAALQGEGGGRMQLSLVRQEKRTQALVPDFKLILVLADLQVRHNKVGMRILDGREQGDS
jgi:hypothetical protein